MSAFNEQQVRERLLDRFMNMDPLEIQLHRPTFTTTASGGTVESATTVLDPQLFYFVPFKRRLTIEYVYNPQTYGENKAEYIHYIMIFPRGTDIQVADYFLVTGTDRLENGRYTIEFVSPRVWDRGQAGALFRG